MEKTIYTFFHKLTKKMKYGCDYRFPEINENHIERQLSIKFLWTDRTNAIETKITKKDWSFI